MMSIGIESFPRQDVFFDQDCPSTIDDLCSFLQGRLQTRKALTTLHSFGQQHPEFIKEVLPFLWGIAKMEFVPLSSISDVGTVVLTQRQALQILTHSFFCSFARDSYRWVDYPSINMDRLFFEGRTEVLRAKLEMFGQYFICQKKRIDSGDALLRKLVFCVQRSRSTVEDWEKCTMPLTNLLVHPLRASIDDAKDCFRVDFANKYLGGAALSHGCVQEEIMFVLLPELNVGRLFCPAMKDEEAIVIQGAEQFSMPLGYGWSFRNGGRYRDPSSIEDNILQSHIVAMDAVDYRYQHPHKQYSEAHILRDLNKAYAGFSAPHTPSTVATGNWGCGVFGGNAEFKSLLQWISASRAGKNVEYFPFDHRNIANHYPQYVKCALEKKLRVCDLLHFARTVEPHQSIASQLKTWLASKD